MSLTVSRAQSEPEGPNEAIAYRTVPVGPMGGAGRVAALRARLGAETFEEVLRLNRVDPGSAPRLDSLVVPVREHGFRAVSPFVAHVPKLEGVPKAIVVSNSAQAFAAYAAGTLVRWGPVSTGARTSPTPAGAYRVNWKSPLHTSTVNPAWSMPWCVNIESRLGIALHEYTLPGRPASHCCVRLGRADARWIHDWVDSWTLAQDGRTVLAPGTPVWILGSYDFAAPPPWRRLAADPEADRVRDREWEAAFDSVDAAGGRAP